jgi:hypothetical protein
LDAHRDFALSVPSALSESFLARGAAPEGWPPIDAVELHERVGSRPKISEERELIFHKRNSRVGTISGNEDKLVESIVSPGLPSS